MRLRTSLLAAAASLLAAPALAADVIVDVPAPPVVVEVPFSWSGAYVGAQIGFLNADGEFDESEAFDPTTGLPFILPGGFVDADGLIGGVHAGFNFEFSGGLVVGLYADYDFAGADLDVVFGNGVGFGTDLQIDGIARGLVKAGYGYGRVLPYLQGGIAYASVDFEDDDRFDGFDDENVADDIGFAVGAGIDYALTDNVIVGGDYVYHNFSDFDDSSIDFDVHTFRAKAAFKF